MSTIILLVEDNLDEIEIVKKVIFAAGMKLMVAKNLTDANRLLQTLAGNIDGVLTDIHFPSLIGNDNDKDKPNGLAVVAHCVEHNIPVSVCTDTNHHYSSYIDKVLPVLAKHPNYKAGRIPFTLDRKDWDKATKDLLSLIQKSKL